MQIMMAVDGDQRNELESMIKDLEDENRFLFSNDVYVNVMFV